MWLFLLMPLPRRLLLPTLNFLLDFFPIPPTGFKEPMLWFPSAISISAKWEDKIKITKLEKCKHAMEMKMFTFQTVTLSQLADREKSWSIFANWYNFLFIIVSCITQNKEFNSTEFSKLCCSQLECLSYVLLSRMWIRRELKL